jgi:hypothetical protein
MNANYELKTEKDKDESIEIDKIQNLPETPSNKSSLPMIAGIMLILAGIFALINWIPMLYLDVETLEQLDFISRLQQEFPSITPEQALGFLKTCAIIGMIISVFPLLGGILSIKRKLFGIAVACSIIGIFSIGLLFSSSVLSLVGLLLLVISRKEYS